MDKLISKDTESDFTKLGLYQVVGGAIGILFFLWSIRGMSSVSGIAIAIYLIFLIFYVYSIISGILCLKTSKHALQHSLINQLLQVIGFALMGLAFKYIAGFYFTIGFDLTESINVTFGIGLSKFDFNFNNEYDRLEIDINIVALLLIFWIDHLMKRVKDEKLIRSANSIGD